jgi:chitodextrinase
MARNLSRPSGTVWALPKAIPDRQPPGAPVGLTASADPVALAVTLRWTAPADDKGVVSYRIYRDGSLAGTSTTPTFTDPDRAHKTEYRYSVVALDAAGNLSTATPAVSTYVS